MRRWSRSPRIVDGLGGACAKTAADDYEDIICCKVCSRWNVSCCPRPPRQLMWSSTGLEGSMVQTPRGWGAVLLILLSVVTLTTCDDEDNPLGPEFDRPV